MRLPNPVFFHTTKPGVWDVAFHDTIYGTVRGKRGSWSASSKGKRQSGFHTKREAGMWVLGQYGVDQ